MNRSFASLFSATLVLSTSVLAQRRFPSVPVPSGNPITTQKALLGKVLFFEEQMSATRTMACATCHVYEAGGADPRALQPGSVHPGSDGVFQTPDDVIGSRGVIGNERDGTYRATRSFGLHEQVTNRRAMTVINAAFAQRLFWDGRAGPVFRDPLTNSVVLTENAALETQSTDPPVSDVEMAHFGENWNDVVARLAVAKPLALASDIPLDLAQFIGNNGYPELFRRAFGTRAVTPARVAMAIATHQRTLISNQSPFDDFRRGNQNALTPQQQQGLQLFNSRRTRCNTCHQGPLFTDNQFHNTGVRPVAEDPGRFAVTNDPRDRGAFKTPGLRNVALRAPFFHNGRMRTLMEVIAFYNRGGDSNDNKDNRIQRLRLSPGERAALVAFLEALTDPRVRAGTAPFDRPMLYTETANVPVLFGTGSAGTLGIVPRAIAIEPPKTGNPNLTFGLASGLGGAPAILLLDWAGNSRGTVIAGVRVHLGLTPGLFFAFPTALRGSGAGNGYASGWLPVPDDASLHNVSLFGQWFSIDAGAPTGITASEALRATFF